MIGDLVWSGLRKKIGDLVFFFYLFIGCLLWTAGIGGGCGWVWLMVDVVVVGAVYVF